MNLKGFLTVLFAAAAVAAQAQILDKYVTIGTQMLDEGEVGVAYQSLSEGERVNNINTRYYLGMCCANGWGCEQDLQKAFSFYRKSAESGNDDAKVATALMLARGQGVAANPAKVKYWVEKLLMSHKPQGYFLKGVLQIEGLVYKQDAASGAEQVQKAVDAGLPDACVYLAFALRDSNPTQGASLIDKACALANNSYIYLDRKGEYLLALGQKSQARDLWQQMITASPAYGMEFNSTFANAMRASYPLSSALKSEYNASRDEKYAMIDGEAPAVVQTKAVAQQPAAKQTKPESQRTYYTPTVSSTPIVVEDKQSTPSKAAGDGAKMVAESDVDMNIPQGGAQNDNWFAVIIGNENYQDVDKVPYANRDADIFAQYCQKTLGLPQSNVHLVKDATLNNIKRELNWLGKIGEAYGSDANVIFYYAGHGIPDESTKQSYLLPVDGFGTDVTTGYPLTDLYDQLGALTAKSVLVMLDACFSGASRSGNMVAQARGVAIEPKETKAKGNMVVLSATQKDETAYPLEEEGHGLFTYYLLKKLQQSRGNTTLGELSDYITDNVKKKSIVVNGKSQTPTVVPSPTLQDWRTRSLK